MSDSTDLQPGFINRPPVYTQPIILQRMLAALANKLPDLKTRDTDDPTVALLDAWAMVLDVMSFYQQQFNKESYLNTATEILSARQLARMVNYELNPGVAASTYLAFQIDSNANNTGKTTISKGTQVQSIPSQGTSPQTFETGEDFTAYASWNKLKPYQPQVPSSQTINGNTTSLWLAGIATRLTKGDVLLLTGDKDANTQVAYQLVVQEIKIDATNSRTQIIWQTGWATDTRDLSGNDADLGPTDALSSLSLYVFRQHTSSFGSNAPLVSSFPASSYYMQPGRNDWDDLNQITNGKSIIPTIWQDSQAVLPFAPKIYLNQSLPVVVKDSIALLTADGMQKLYQVTSTEEVSRADFGISGHVTSLMLCNFSIKISSTTPGVKAETYKDLRTISDISQRLAKSALVTLKSVPTTIPADTSEAVTLTGGKDATLTEPATAAASPVGAQLDLTAKNPGSAGNNISFSISFDFGEFPFRTTAIHAQSEPLTLYTNAIGEEEFVLQKVSQGITLENNVSPNLQIGQKLIISDLQNSISETFTLGDIKEVEGRTVLYPQNDFTNGYQPENSIIYGNVVAATHGASTIQEVIGSGDATQANQQFTLQKSPLTYIPSSASSCSSATNASLIPGIQSTLTIQVNDITWQEKPSLYGLTHNSKNYIVAQDDDGKVKITFGNGTQGARLPTGQENIKATYRQGLGKIGNVARDSLVLLQTRPQGVATVTNPVAARGGADPQTLSAARQNAPTSVSTMGRLVSQTDFENYANIYAGVNKSRIDLLQQDGYPLVYITVVGEDGAVVTDNTMMGIQNDMQKMSNSGQAIYVGSYESVQFNLEATLLLDPTYHSGQVESQVRQALLNQYGLDKQDLAQAVTAGDIIKTMLNIPGVIGADLNYLYPTEDKNPSLTPVISATKAYIDSAGGQMPAQLLTINPAEITLNLQNSTKCD
jgi:hypothetical protein